MCHQHQTRKIQHTTRKKVALKNHRPLDTCAINIKPGNSSPKDQEPTREMLARNSRHPRTGDVPSIRKPKKLAGRPAVICPVMARCSRGLSTWSLPCLMTSCAVLRVADAKGEADQGAQRATSARKTLVFSMSPSAARARLSQSRQRQRVVPTTPS